MGGVEVDNRYLRQIDRLREWREAPGSVVATKCGSEAAECDSKRDYGKGKGVVMVI